jgi:hypothetical protein
VIESKLAGFEYLSPDEDWADVEANLPEYQLFADIRKREFHELRAELISFFSSAIVSRTVSIDQIHNLGSEVAKLDDEARECIVRVLDELGVEVLEDIDSEIASSSWDTPSDDELELAENATAYFGISGRRHLILTGFTCVTSARRSSSVLSKRLSLPRAWSIAGC